MPIISADPLDRVLALSASEHVMPNLQAAAAAERREEDIAFAVESAISPEKPKILAEGDSWFAYPRQYYIFGAPANVIQHLRKHDDFIIQNTSNNGDEMINMLTGSAKVELLDRLKATSYAILLFSGGGNDIVGAFDMDFFLHKKIAGMSALDCLNKARFERRLNQVANAYHDLMDLVADYSLNPDIQVVTHTYDYVVPGNKGASFFGGIYKYDDGRSWMYPFMMAKGIVDPADQRAIARWMLDRFRETIGTVSAYHSHKLHVVNTQGLLGDSDWLNEIHPTPDGFRKVADKIYLTIKELLGGGIPQMDATPVAAHPPGAKAKNKITAKPKSRK